MLGGLSSGHAVDGIVGASALAVEQQIAVAVLVQGYPVGGSFFKERNFVR